MSTAIRAAPHLAAAHFLLHGLSPADLDSFAKAVRVRSFAGDEPVFLKGDRASDVMLVVSGRVRLCAVAAEGRELTLNVFHPGELFGETAMVEGSEHPAAAIALEATDIMMLKREHFLEFLGKYPQAWLLLVQMLSNRLNFISSLAEDMILLSPQLRLAKRLLYLCDHCGKAAAAGVQIELRLSQQLLSSMIGVSRQCINLMLRRWKGDGLIDVQRNSITVLDPQRLRHLARDD
jgi:CRP/FNR family transcriptional regulator